MIDFEEKELVIIEKFLNNQINDWSDKDLDSIKSKIKEYFKTLWTEQCCYCKRGLEDEFNMVIDIEHILPKSSFRYLSFNLQNLNLSCKRCNMRIKKEKINFLFDLEVARDNFTNSLNYKFIHPNFDLYETNMRFLNFTLDSRKFIKYMPFTEKGRYSYTYFHLDKIERSSLNFVQGITNNLEDNTENIPEEIFDIFDQLVKKL